MHQYTQYKQRFLDLKFYQCHSVTILLTTYHFYLLAPHGQEGNIQLLLSVHLLSHILSTTPHSVLVPIGSKKNIIVNPSSYIYNVVTEVRWCLLISFYYRVIKSLCLPWKVHNLAPCIVKNLIPTNTYVWDMVSNKCPIYY